VQLLGNYLFAWTQKFSPGHLSVGELGLNLFLAIKNAVAEGLSNIIFAALNQEKIHRNASPPKHNLAR
jgi:hypothetical protein